MLHERIAVGGMAEIFRATPADGGPAIALKRMLPALAEDGPARAMFAEERRHSAHISHPNVVALIDGGEENGLPYLALELVLGLDLHRLTRFLRQSSRVIGPALAVHVVRETLAGLHAVHELRGSDGRALGVVHRDVSPSNVLLSLDGEVKLADLGIAAPPATTANNANTTASRAKGKLGYLAPEQVIGMPLDRRADVFAAGVVLAELLIGRPLFAGGSELAILLAIRDGDLRALHEHGAQLPQSLRTSVLCALAQSPADRFPDALAFREALAPHAVPEQAARRELAELVRRGVAVARSNDGDEATPVHDVVVDSRTPQTADMPSLDYTIETTAGKRMGPWPFARIIEAIATAKIAANDRVSQAGGPFVPLLDVPALARHLPLVSTATATLTHEAPRAPNTITDLANGGVVRAVCLAILNEQTGLLLCEQSGVRKEVYFRNGRPEFVASNIASELLGEFLVARSVISRGELDMALAVLPRFEGRLGDTLAALGLVPPVELFRHIATQVREKLVELFLWSAGKASFYRGAEPPKSRFPLELDAWAIVEEGVRRRVAQGIEDDLLADGDHTFVTLVDRLPRDVPLKRLPPAAARLVEELAMAATLSSLEQEGSLSMALVLLRLGVLRTG